MEADDIKLEWLRKCTLRFHERAGLSMDAAKEQAELCYDNDGSSLDPEEAADEEMSYWTDDEAGEA